MSDSHWSAPKVSARVFLGHHWGVAGVSSIFVAFRIAIRIKYFHRIWVDDMLMIAAWAMLCGAATLYQTQSINLYHHYPLVTGKIPATVTNLKRERTLLSSLLAEYYLFYTTLWIIKLSVLLFFRRILSERRRTPWLMAWWWFVTSFTISSWAACIGTLPYRCLLRSLPWILAHCARQDAINYTWINLQLSCATDIVTEVMILSIPVIGLWNVRIPFYKKLALVGILCLTGVTILFAVIRIAVTPNKTSTADITWLCLWAHIETGVAVIVACLASFRQLFVKENQPGPGKKSLDSGSSQRSSRIRSLFTRVFPSSSNATSTNSLHSLQFCPHNAESSFSTKSVEDSVSKTTISEVSV